MKAVGVVLLVAGVLWLAACGESKKPVEASSGRSRVVEPWEAEYDRLYDAVHPGMTKNEVVEAIGEPTNRRTVISGDVVEVWRYEMGPNMAFQVNFNDRERVVGRLIRARDVVY